MRSYFLAPGNRRPLTGEYPLRGHPDDDGKEMPMTIASLDSP